MKSNKFRVWCNDNNEWEKDLCFVAQDGVLVHQMSNGYYVPLNKDSHIVEFFTGLKDKNGKEIYEGDKVIMTDVYGGTMLCIVCFNDGCFDIESHNGFRDYLKCHTINHAIEIVGNIHESKA